MHTEEVSTLVFENQQIQQLLDDSNEKERIWEMKVFDKFQSGI